MPRPTRAQGRPDTRVFPADWNDSHAVVVGKTLTGTCIFWAQADAPVAGPDLSYATPTQTAPLYVGGCRIQLLNSAEAAALIGDQRQVTAGYLVVIDYTADIPLGAVGQITTCTDESLLGDRRLVVAKVARGTQRWERDLWCVDDMTRTGA